MGYLEVLWMRFISTAVTSKKIVEAVQKLVILAGGLNPENVKEAIETVRPYGVDAASGVEKEPGKKDYDKAKRFVEKARAGE